MCESTQFEQRARTFLSAWGRVDPSGAAEAVAYDMSYCDAHSGPLSGWEAFRDFLQTVQAAAPDIQLEFMGADRHHDRGLIAFRLSGVRFNEVSEGYFYVRLDQQQNFVEIVGFVRPGPSDNSRERTGRAF